jgi:hypothetical protein
VARVGKFLKKMFAGLSSSREAFISASIRASQSLILGNSAKTIGVWRTISSPCSRGSASTRRSLSSLPSKSHGRLSSKTAWHGAATSTGNDDKLRRVLADPREQTRSIECFGRSEEGEEVGVRARDSSLRLDPEQTRIEAIASREGEEIVLQTPIVFAELFGRQRRQAAPGTGRSTRADSEH